MSQFYLLNEVGRGGDATVPSAIYVFPSGELLEQYFEPWFTDETYLLLGDDGQRWLLTQADRKVKITRSDDRTDYSRLLHSFLVYHLESAERAIHEKKRIHAKSLDFSKLDNDVLFKLALLFE
jgi:hypothetical protein